jgi:hypothetical protein
MTSAIQVEPYPIQRTTKHRNTEDGKTTDDDHEYTAVNDSSAIQKPQERNTPRLS